MVKGDGQTMRIEDERKKLMFRLKQTGKGETICLSYWETRLLTLWIEQLTEERNTYHNKHVLLLAELKARGKPD